MPLLNCLYSNRSMLAGIRKHFSTLSTKLNDFTTKTRFILSNLNHIIYAAYTDYPTYQRDISKHNSTVSNVRYRNSCHATNCIQNSQKFLRKDPSQFLIRQNALCCARDRLFRLPAVSKLGSFHIGTLCHKEKEFKSPNLNS